MVVPRSAQKISSDDEFTLYAVTSFKKHGPEFIHKSRERKWVPRDFKVKEGGAEEERREVERVAKEERKLWGETLRLGRTGWSDAVMAWVHVLALRVFVETVLRYGLPLNFVCGLIRVRFDQGWLASSISTSSPQPTTKTNSPPPPSLDNPQTHQKSPRLPRRLIRPPRRQRLRHRQEGPAGQRRRGRAGGYGG